VVLDRDSLMGVSPFPQILFQPQSGGIYVIRSLLDDRFYIGSASNFKDRWSSHRRRLIRRNHWNPILQNFVNKYGLAHLLFDIVEYRQKGELIQAEQFFLDMLWPTGFNINKKAGCGPGGIKGRKPSRECINAVIEANRKRVWTDEARALLSKERSTRNHSEESKQKISRANKGKKRSKKSIENIVEAHWSRGPNADSIKSRLSAAGKILVGRKNPNYRHGKLTRKEVPSGS
jgi:group I intron endonuclease